MEAFAWGIYNPKSHYRVRILELDSESSRTSRTWDAFDVDSLLSHRLAAAVARRAALGLPSTDTDVFRLVNSEGDRVSGLVVDRLGDALVAVPSAAYVQRRRPLVEETLRRLTGISDVIWRPAEDMLRQEGLSDEEIGAASLEAETEKTAAQREVREGGLRYLVEPWGQKTGFYADQRESRAFIRPLCTGKRVLDLCCYSGEALTAHDKHTWPGPHIAFFWRDSCCHG